MEKVNRWLTLVANVGVLVGIVFLIVELDQNTQSQNGSTIQAFVASTAANNSILSSSEDLMAITDRGDREGLDSLDAVEKRRYVHLAIQAFSGWEALYLQTLIGTIDESFWASKRAGLADTLTNKGVRDFWAVNADLWYDPRFRAEIEAIAKEAGIEL
jgi:hypothetical protein